jgi:AcrR family transcriptional regulator
VDFRSKRAQTREHNRRIILDAARGVFGRQGYRTATVRDIIGATSLATGTFYNYFKSKEEVYAALRDELALEIRPLLRAERERATSADDFIAGTFRAFFTHAMQRSDTFAALGAQEDQAASGTRIIVLGSDDLRRDIQAAIENRLLADVDPELLAAAMVGIAFEVAEVLRRRHHADVNGAERFCSDLVLRGIALPAMTRQAVASAGL